MEVRHTAVHLVFFYFCWLSFLVKDVDVNVTALENEFLHVFEVLNPLSSLFCYCSCSVVCYLLSFKNKLFVWLSSIGFLSLGYRGDLFASIFDISNALDTTNKLDHCLKLDNVVHSVFYVEVVK